MSIYDDVKKKLLSEKEQLFVNDTIELTHQLIKNALQKNGDVKQILNVNEYKDLIKNNEKYQAVKVAQISLDSLSRIINSTVNLTALEYQMIVNKHSNLCDRDTQNMLIENKKEE